MISVPESREHLSIMGVPVRPFGSYAQAVEHVADVISSGRKSFCVAINPEKVRQAVRDPQLLAILQDADIGVCDGIGIVLAARLLYGRKIRRCTGCDLFFHLNATAAARGWRVFLLGASPECNAAACARLGEMYPGLKIVGNRDGYFRDSEEVVAEINASRADLVFVAMGSPKQEHWIARHRRSINASFCMGIGGTLDVVSGRAKRAPKVFRRTGTEFLFRLLANPGRWRRQLALPAFVLMAVGRRLLPREDMA